MTLHNWLSELERVEKAATPGPWYKDRDFPEIKKSHTQFVAICDPKHDYSHGMTKCHDDANFIAQSRNALQKLLAIIRVQQEALEKIKSPDMAGLHGMIIADMGLKHFTECTATMALAAVEKIVGGE